MLIIASNNKANLMRKQLSATVKSTGFEIN